MKANNDLIAELVKDAHRRVCEACDTMRTVEHAVKYVESITGERIGNTNDLGFTATEKARSWANLARLDLAGARKAINEDESPYNYGTDEERDRRTAAFIDMLKAVYGDDIKEITGLSAGKLDGKTELKAGDYFTLSELTGVSLGWLFGEGVAQC